MSKYKPPKIVQPRTGGMRTLADFPYINKECSAQTDWIAGPVSQCRDSDNIELANFDALCNRMDDADPYGTDWEIIRFGHFGVGWIDVIFARPSSKCVAALGLAREQLKDSPVLDETLLAEYEADGPFSDETVTLTEDDRRKAMEKAYENACAMTDEEFATYAG